MNLLQRLFGFFKPTSVDDALAAFSAATRRLKVVHDNNVSLAIQHEESAHEMLNRASAERIQAERASRTLGKLQELLS